MHEVMLKSVQEKKEVRHNPAPRVLANRFSSIQYMLMFPDGFALPYNTSPNSALHAFCQAVADFMPSTNGASRPNKSLKWNVIGGKEMWRGGGGG